MTTSRPHRIVFANEKGGTGKSTTAVHVAIALAYQGARVVAIDLDPRQRTMHRYLENRAETERRRAIELPGAACEVFDGASSEALEDVIARLGEGADFVVFDTPGRDDPLARHAATEADTLVTPMNDSFVDFDLIGQVEGESFKVRRLSFYAELIWEARLKRSRATIEQQRRDIELAEQHRRGDRQDSARRGMEASGSGFRLLQFLQDAIDVAKVAPPRFGERDAPRRAAEQTDAKPILERWMQEQVGVAGRQARSS